MRPFFLKEYIYNPLSTSRLPKSRSKPQTKIKLEISATPQQTFCQINEWRKKFLAPVDTIGCEELYQKNQPLQIKKYQTLISLMLSVQTKDEITSQTVKKLQSVLKLNPKTISQCSQQVLQQIIKSCNYHKGKAKHIIKASQIIMQKGMPQTLEEVVKLPGVGTKIGVLYINSFAKFMEEDDQDANNYSNNIKSQSRSQIVGIGVDTHVHRIANRLQWVKTEDPKKTEVQLQTVFKQEIWGTINKVLVGFGQIMCKAAKPKCQQCPVSQQCNSRIQF